MANPFAETLRLQRIARGQRQDELARAVGCDRGTISALENDHRESVDQEFVGALANALTLSDSERAELFAAHRDSQRVYVIPPETSPSKFVLVRRLFDRLERMPPVQVDALLTSLDAFASVDVGQAEPSTSRLWRRDKVWKPQPEP
ncbi:helix-turn-helix domain-containing protein [Rhizobacter fulvus]